MILEGIVTTLGPSDKLNIAPMGPDVDPGAMSGGAIENGPGLDRFVLRPFQTATTFVNLKAHGEGVLHVTDDVLLLANAAIGAHLDPAPPTRPAECVAGRVLLNASRYYEFRVLDLDDREERARIVVETVAWGRLRDFFGFNRAKHAVLEAAVLATRLQWLALDEVSREFARLAVLVEKTGGPSERLAFDVLNEHLRAFAARRGAGASPGPISS